MAGPKTYSLFNRRVLTAESERSITMEQTDPDQVRLGAFLMLEQGKRLAEKCK
ncbi:MAG: hypothetical protein KGM96_15480 [Acidobacteriota bacterium]|nr:hypothetical protein [Acidobacteriota bacterium]